MVCSVRSDDLKGKVPAKRGDLDGSGDEVDVASWTGVLFVAVVEEVTRRGGDLEHEPSSLPAAHTATLLFHPAALEELLVARLLRGRRRLRSVRAPLLQNFGRNVGFIGVLDFHVFGKDPQLFGFSRRLVVGLDRCSIRMVFEDAIGVAVTHHSHVFHCLFFPDVQIHRANLTDVHTQRAMDARTFNTNENPQIDGSPPWQWITTISTHLVRGI